ncbi:AraC family transcriptional regulator [Marinomonas epiphytica]
MNVKSETIKNQPIIIKNNIYFNNVSIRSFWDVNGDESYSNKWPEDRVLALRENTLVIVYAEKGKGTIRLKDASQVSVRGNCLVFLNPKDIKGYWCDGYLWKLYWIEINNHPANRPPLNQVIPIENHRHFAFQFDEFIACLRQEEFPHQQYAAALFNKMFFEWLLLANTENQSNSQRRVHRVIEEMHHQLSVNWQVRAMADFCGCSEQHLRKLFLKYTGLSPKDYYQKLKLDIALGMLKRGNKSITQIADALGYTDNFHFSNAFKRKFGYSPSQVKAVTPLALQLVRNEGGDK